jgi:hypothetical protein
MKLVFHLLNSFFNEEKFNTTAMILTSFATNLIQTNGISMLTANIITTIQKKNHGDTIYFFKLFIIIVYIIKITNFHKKTIYHLPLIYWFLLNLITVGGSMLMRLWVQISVKKQTKQRNKKTKSTPNTNTRQERKTTKQNKKTTKQYINLWLCLLFFVFCFALSYFVVLCSFEQLGGLRGAHDNIWRQRLAARA